MVGRGVANPRAVDLAVPDALRPVKRPRQLAQTLVVVLPVALDVAADDDKGDRACAGVAQGGGSALGVGAGGPCVVNEEYGFA